MPELLSNFGILALTCLGVVFNCILNPAAAVDFPEEQNVMAGAAGDGVATGGIIGPYLISTWPFSAAANQAWNVLKENGSALDAVEVGCSACEAEQCDFTVGFGGSPDEDGEVALDAMIFDGSTHRMGGVAAMKRIKNAISVARKVMEHTKHTLLVGEGATKFAVQMGFKEEDLQTEFSRQVWNDWKSNNCQPNFWQNVSPDPLKGCGPYRPATEMTAVAGAAESDDVRNAFTTDVDDRYIYTSHDTIGIVAIDNHGNIAAGTSTNGAKFKIPGRVGDSSIPGSGAYVDKYVGGAAASGDGDILMRFLPSLVTVEKMRSGLSPSQAADAALRRIMEFYPSFMGVIVALSKDGQFGAACHGIPRFDFCVGKPMAEKAEVLSVPCISSHLHSRSRESSFMLNM